MNFTRKEVKIMPYEKPEVIVLGEAALLIQGSKGAVNDAGQGIGDDSDLEN
jgi:hypothetical protein